MAVARIIFPDRASAIQASGILLPEQPRGARELRSAADRRERRAELTAPELRALAERADYLFPRVRPLVAAAVEELDAAETEENRRPRGPALTRGFTSRRRGH